MAKRLTASEKWEDPWFVALKERDKLFWLYMLDKCNHAGIWQVNLPLARFYFGPDYVPPMQELIGRIVILSESKWFIPKFIDFQYGQLNPQNRVHLSILGILKKEGVCKGLPRALHGAKDKDKDKDKDNRGGMGGGDLPLPTPEQVSTYGREIGFDLDGNKFVDFYTSKGWMIGKNKMRNWQAAVRTWKRKILSSGDTWANVAKLE